MSTTSHVTAYMVRKMATPRGQGLPADIAPAESAA